MVLLLLTINMFQYRLYVKYITNLFNKISFILLFFYINKLSCMVHQNCIYFHYIDEKVNYNLEY